MTLVCEAVRCKTIGMTLSIKMKLNQSVLSGSDEGSVWRLLYFIPVLNINLPKGTREENEQVLTKSGAFYTLYVLLMFMVPD